MKPSTRFIQHELSLAICRQNREAASTFCDVTILVTVQDRLSIWLATPKINFLLRNFVHLEDETSKNLWNVSNAAYLYAVLLSHYRINISLLLLFNKYINQHFHKIWTRNCWEQLYFLSLQFIQCDECDKLFLTCILIAYYYISFTPVTILETHKYWWRVTNLIKNRFYIQQQEKWNEFWNNHRGW